MKKLISILVCITISVAAFAIETNSNFGFKRQNTEKEYQQYVGQSIVIRRPHGFSETWKGTGLHHLNNFYGKTFIIRKVKVKSAIKENIPVQCITIKAYEQDTKRITSFCAYDSPSDPTGEILTAKELPFIEHLPVFFSKTFSDFVNSQRNRLITNPLVKESYRITDLFIGKDSDKNAATATINARIKSTETGEISTFPYSEIDTQPFSYALKMTHNPILERVEKPLDSSKRYGEITTIQDEGLTKFSFKDNTIAALTFCMDDKFVFKLDNISDHSIKILWDDASYVDMNGVTSKIMHTTIKYSERSNHQTPTTIISGASLLDCALPINNVYLDETLNTKHINHKSYSHTLGLFTMTTTYLTVEDEWKTRPLIPTGFETQSLTGKKLRLMLPIEVKGVVNEYTFIFNIESEYTHPELLNIDKKKYYSM